MPIVGKATGSLHYRCGCVMIKDVVFLCSTHLITFKRTLDKQ